MSEQSAIDTYGDELFGRGTQAALDALGKAYELAFMKGLSQLSSPSATIVDRTGQIGVAREIANYKTSLALADTLALQVQTRVATRAFRPSSSSCPSEFSEFAADAGSRIINASAFPMKPPRSSAPLPRSSRPPTTSCRTCWLPRRVPTGRPTRSWVPSRTRWPRATAPEAIIKHAPANRCGHRVASR